MDKDESKPPIDPSLILPSATTKPKRTKTTHACDLCKKKKVKCNGEHPCIKCQKLAVPCTFTPNQSKWDSSAPYATTQVQRLYALERALDSLRVDLPAQSLVTANYPTSSNNNTTSATITSPLGKFNTSSTGKPYYADDWDTRLDGLPAACYKTTNLLKKETSLPDGLALSEMTTIHFDIISSYFGQVHPYFPIIHQESFFHDLSSTSLLLLNAMYAIATQWSDMGDLLPGSGGSPSDSAQEQQPSSQKRAPYSLKYYRDAIALVEHYMDAPRLSTIQALLLIIKYQELVRRPGFFSRTRFYLGLVVRMCNDLGLSHILPPTCQVQPTLAEERRRVFWATYIYDLLISTELGTPANFSIDHCAVELPGLLDDEKNNKEQHDAILYLHWMTKMVKTQGMVLQYLRQKYEDQPYQQQQNSARRLHSMDQYVKELGMELAAWREHGDDRFDFVFLTYHFTNILLYRSLSLDLLDKTTGDGTVKKIGLGTMAGQDSVKTILLQEANAITNIVDTLISSRTVAGLHHGFRGAQQLIHYLTAVRTVQLMCRHDDDAHVKGLIHHLTTLTPVVELYAMDQQRSSCLGEEMGLAENGNQHSTERRSEKPTNHQRLPAPLPSSLSLSPPAISSSSNGLSSSPSPSPLVNTAYHRNTAEYLPQSSAIYADEDFADSLNSALPNTSSYAFSSGTFWQHQRQMDQHWSQQQQQQQQQNGASLTSTSKHNASLTLDTSALPLLYQPSSSSDISPMIPTPLSLNVMDPATNTPTTPSSATHPSIRARRSHQHLRKPLPPQQWLPSSTTAAVSDHLSPNYSQPSPSAVAPPQRLHPITSRQSSPSTSSLPSSPLHRMTLSDDPAPWIQTTTAPALVLPSYPQQQQQHQERLSHPPLSQSYIQLYGHPLPPDDQHVNYNTTLLDNTMLSAPPVDESMNELLAPTSLDWNHL